MEELKPDPIKVRRRLWYGQSRLIADREHFEQAVIAGYGYGKTKFGCFWMLDRILKNPRCNEFLCIALDYQMARNICQKTFIEMLEDDFKLRLGVHFKSSVSSGNLYVQLLWGCKPVLRFLTAEVPKKIKGYNSGATWFDESGSMAEEALSNGIARTRKDTADFLQVLHTTTPEGENAFFERMKPSSLTRVEKHSFDERRLVLHGSSYDNITLPEAYLLALEDEYGWDEAFFQNYVMGNFYSLARNRFYFSFIESKVVKQVELMQDLPRLCLTFDFNIGKMSWSAFQVTGSGDRARFRVIKSNNGRGHNIAHACQQFRDSFPPETFGYWALSIRGDAAGHNRSPQTFTTGYEVIEQELKPFYPNLSIDADFGNPFVSERSVTTNRLLEQGRVIIDPSCVSLLESLKMTQTDSKGGVKKTNKDDVTHAAEALDMALISFCPPVRRIEGANRGRNLV